MDLSERFQHGVSKKSPSWGAWVNKWLKDRLQRRRVDCQTSQWREVPRGARLESLLLAAFVCDLEKGMKAMAEEERAVVHMRSDEL